MRDGREHVPDGCSIGEIGLNSLYIGVGFRETLQGPVLGVVVCSHLGAKRWEVELLRRHDEAHGHSVDLQQ